MSDKNKNNEADKVLVNGKEEEKSINGNKAAMNSTKVPRSNETSSMTQKTKAAVEFAKLCGKLKTTKRTGWVLRQVPNPETVADHSWRVSILSYLLLYSTNQQEEESSASLDIAKCIEMAVVHDLAESIVGDIAPSDNVSKEDKQRMEEEAMDTISKLLQSATTKGVQETKDNEKYSMKNNRLMEIFHEYEERKTPEAKAVKDLDLLDMILQADEYEQCTMQNCRGDDDNAGVGIDLTEFFEGTPPSRFQNEWLRSIATEIHQQREERRHAETEKQRKDQEEHQALENERLSVDDVASTTMSTTTSTTITGKTQRNDDEFVNKFAPTSNLSKEDIEQVVRALRQHDATSTNSQEDKQI